VRCGFTLLEALMAAAILLVIVAAVTTAVTAGQQNALEAHRRIAAVLAAEELMTRLTGIDYDDLPAWNGHVEAAGTMTDADGEPLPATFGMIGRDVRVTLGVHTAVGLGVQVIGRTVRVRASDGEGRILAEFSRFVPQPAEETLQ
jgi:prepilin-type N-terminal cleavage/methylation domain-containing protein